MTETRSLKFRDHTRILNLLAVIHHLNIADFKETTGGIIKSRNNQ